MNNYMFNCPHCDQSIEAPVDMLGEMIDCPTCQKSIIIPSAKKSESITSMTRQRLTTHKHTPSLQRYRENEHAERDLNTGRLLQTRTKLPPSQSASLHRPFLIAGGVLLATLLAGWGGFLWQQTKKDPTTPIDLNVEPLAKRATSETQTKASPPLPRGKNASMSGGFWITKGDGSSEIVRGNNIYLLKGEVKSDLVNPLLQKLEAELSKLAQECEKNAAFFDGSVASAYTSHAEHTGRAASHASNYQQIDFVPVRQLYFMIRTLNYSIVSEKSTYMSIAKDHRWPKLIGDFVVTYTQTGIDGRYQFSEVPPGKYTIFTILESKFNYVEWCLDVEMESAQSYTLDIHNRNAASILSIRN